MSIVVSKNGKDAQKLDKANFADEDYMQEYIHNNPESIPIYELQKDKKLFVMKREFPTNAGPIDALAVDEDGDIYIVETKLYKNPDKRTVVAQALDYGAALWKHLNDFTVFIDTLDTEMQKQFGMSFSEKLIDFYAMEESDDVDILLEAMRVNLNEGNIKFVILMDSIDERLKDLILYVNQNSQFDIYAVQLEYYKYEEYEIMIPKIFGLEVKKNISKGISTRKKWTEGEYMAQSEQKLGVESNKVVDLYKYFKYDADGINWGTSKKNGSYAPIYKKISNSISPFSLYSDGSIMIKFSWLKNEIKEETLNQCIDEFSTCLTRVNITITEEDFLKSEPLISSKDFIVNSKHIIKGIKELLKLMAV